MGLDAIMEIIMSGLTGDMEADIVYLQEQMGKYKNDPQAAAIMQECGRIMYELLPEEKKAELAQAGEQDQEAFDKALDQISFLINAKDYDKALEAAKILVEDVEKSGLYQEDEDSDCFSFEEPMDEVLYHYVNDDGGETLRHAMIPYSRIYTLYGRLLAGMKKFQEAKEILSKAMRWNPYNGEAVFEYAELFKIDGDMETYLALTKMELNQAYRSKDVARCYLNLAYYFAEKKMFDVAAACMVISLKYDADNQFAKDEFAYIKAQTGSGYQDPTMEEIQALAEKHNIPLGASEDSIGLALSYGKHYAEEHVYDAARYFLGIAYELTDAAEIKEMLDQIPEN